MELLFDTEESAEHSKGHYSMLQKITAFTTKVLFACFCMHISFYMYVL